MKISLSTIDDLAQPPAQPSQPARRMLRNGLRNYLLSMTCIIAGGTLFLWGWEGSVYLNPTTAITGLLIWLAAMLIMLALRAIGRI
jgi:hypothetical protein